MKQRVAYFVMIWDAVILVPVQEAKKWMLDELLSFPICRSAQRSSDKIKAEARWGWNRWVNGWN